MAEESSTDDDEDDIAKTRRTYSKKVKEKAIELVKKFGFTRVVDKCNIPESTVKRWVKEGAPSNPGKRGRKVKHPDVEEEVSKFFNEKRQAHKPTTSRIIIRKARQVAERLKITDTKYSWGWFVKFLKRNRLSIRAPTTRLTKPLDTLITKANEFSQKFKKYLENRNL